MTTDWTFASILPTLPVADVVRTRSLLMACLPFEIASGSATHAVLTLGGGGPVAVKLVQREVEGGGGGGSVETTIVLGGTTGLERLYASLLKFVKIDGNDKLLEVDEVANVGWGKRQFKLILLPERHVLQFVQDKVIPQC